MTDPFDDLKRKFERTTPEPDAERRKAALTRAMELFDRRTTMEPFDRRGESEAGPRRGAARRYLADVADRVQSMLAALTTRPVLAAAAGLAAVGFALLLVFADREATPQTGTVVAEIDDTNPPEPALPSDTRAVDRDMGLPEQSTATPAEQPEPAVAPAGAATPETDAVDLESVPAAREAGPVAPPPIGSRQESRQETDSPFRRTQEAEVDSFVARRLGGEHQADPAAVGQAADLTGLPDRTDGPGVEGTWEADAVDLTSVLEQVAETLREPLSAIHVYDDDHLAAPTMPQDVESYTQAMPPPGEVGEPPLRERPVEHFNLVDAVAEPVPQAKAMRPGEVEESFDPQAPEFRNARVGILPEFRSDTARARLSDRSLSDAAVHRRPSTEAFSNEPPSPVEVAAEAPVSTFSIDVDTASYSVVRSSLLNGYLPAVDSVRIEELVNYFPYAYPPPGENGAPFRPTVTVSETPWNPDTLLMHIGIQARQPATDDRPPLNLVFLIDTSGSMDQPNKLPLLVQSFRLMVGQLDPADEVAIVTYAESAGRVLDATASTERGTILAALDRLAASGSTAGAAGIQLAYRTAEEMAAEGEVTRVILATDGDFNVGISDPERLEQFIARKRAHGIYLSVLGFGRGNLNDATMQALAQNGNGQAAFIDTLSEARKVLVDQLTGTLFPVADDVKIQVEFNPATVAEYRLIGYETRALRRQDFHNDRVDAGEIGAGHTVTAIYEVTPVGSPAVLHDALRYADPSSEPPRSQPGSGAGAGELAFLRLRYKEPGEDRSELIELPITRDTGTAGDDQRFAAAVAGFGQRLRGSVYTGDWSYADAIALAEANTGNDPYGYRHEAVTLMRLAESLAK